MFVLMGILMVVTCVFLLITSFEEDNFQKLVLMGIGGIGTIFFGFCLGFIIKQLIVGKKLVVVNEEGFYDFSSAIASKQLVEWGGVREIGIFSISGQSFITVHLFDGDAYIESLPSIKRGAIRANLRLGSGHININISTAKGVTIEELLQVMSDFYLAYLKQLPEVEVETVRS
ncbi:hypothetical protein D0S48_16730 [Psychrobacillus sp. AK 1817]|nr:hypothetical protein D0S48_16730 [Psychrobacillus sp. AK 1817]